MARRRQRQDCRERPDVTGAVSPARKTPSEGDVIAEQVISSWRGHLIRDRHRVSRSVLFWLVLVLIVLIGWRLGFDRHLVAATAILWGVLTHILGAALAFLLSAAGGVPILGPLLVKAITLPLVFIINGLAFLASLLGIKKGHGRKVLESRLVAGLLTLGILIGYILGKLF